MLRIKSKARFNVCIFLLKFLNDSAKGAETALAPFL